MTENPFTSPTLSADELNAHGSPRNGRGPLQMGLLGALAGGIVVGFTGLVTAGSIALVAVIWMGEDIETVYFCAAMGFIFACLGGVPGGLVLGAVAGMTAPSFRGGLRMICMIPTILFAMACSLLGGAFSMKACDSPGESP